MKVTNIKKHLANMSAFIPYSVELPYRVELRAHSVFVYVTYNIGEAFRVWFAHVKGRV